MRALLELSLPAVNTQKKESSQSRIDILRVSGSDMSDVIGDQAKWKWQGRRRPEKI